ncbi:hypothetical protein SFRURICE_001020 [Spodoptera frugiperda]|nr:hypothetical protein SFRURICE_001020 [Spodoptera frugiperda]
MISRVYREKRNFKNILNCKILFKIIFPTTNTCSNTLPYLYDGHSWAEYAFYFVTMFWRRISMLAQFSLHKQETSDKNQPALDSGHRACYVVGPPCQYNAWEPRYLTIAPQYFDMGQWLNTLVPRRYIGMGVQLHDKRGVQNLTLVDFYLKSLVYGEGIGRVSKFFSKT